MTLHKYNIIMNCYELLKIGIFSNITQLYLFIFLLYLFIFLIIFIHFLLFYSFFLYSIQ